MTPELWCNSGGPSSRTRTERVVATLLDNDSDGVRCPCVLRVGIDFGRKSPLTYAHAWLKACGFKDEEDARASFVLPAGPRLCHLEPNQPVEQASELLAFEGLRLVLILGLCTPWLYDPTRPVLWTRPSLTRRVALFETGGFYA